MLYNFAIKWCDLAVKIGIAGIFAFIRKFIVFAKIIARRWCELRCRMNNTNVIMKKVIFTNRHIGIRSNIALMV